MTIAHLQSLLGWSALLNYVLLLVSFVAWIGAGDALFRLHARWFRLDRPRYDQTAYLVFGLYKLGIWLFLLVPWLALRFIVVPATGGGP